TINMMNILLATGEYPPLQGGVGAYTAELASALNTLGVQVSVMTSTSVATGHQTQPNNVPVYPSVKRWDWRIWSAIHSHAETIGADWIHVQYQTAAFGMNPAINVAPWRWRASRFNVAWTYHDLLIPYLFPKAGDGLRRWVTEWPSTQSDLTIVTNEGDRLQLAEKNVPQLHKIPIGSNIQGKILPESECQQRRVMRGYGQDDLVLAYFGFLNRSKGGKLLIRTLHQLVQQRPNTYLLMIGERVGASDVTNYAYLQEVEALVADLGLTAHVQWTGHQSQEDVSADLHACDVLVMPYADGVSLRRGTLMAGLANGCAIVTTTPQAPLPELVDGEDLCYAAYDADALTAAINRIVTQPEFAATLQKNAYAKSKQFTWDTIAQQHVACYQSI
ncbi:MAG: glycosyltransferase family 4 protein, partial [Chloroflexota bacterium]